MVYCILILQTQRSNHLYSSAASDLYKGQLKNGMPAEPGAVKAKVLVVHGADDPIAPKGDRDFLEDEMGKAGARWTILAFGGVFHSFTDPSPNRPPASQYSAPPSSPRNRMAQGSSRDALPGRIWGPCP